MFVLLGVCWHGCLLLWLYPQFAIPVFIIPVCCPLFVATIIVSTSNFPYKQWFVGGLVVLCDVAAAGAAEVAVGGVMLLLLAVAVAV